METVKPKSFEALAQFSRQSRNDQKEDVHCVTSYKTGRFFHTTAGYIVGTVTTIALMCAGYFLAKFCKKRRNVSLQNQSDIPLTALSGENECHVSLPADMNVAANVVADVHQEEQNSYLEPIQSSPPPTEKPPAIPQEESSDFHQSSANSIALPTAKPRAKRRPFWSSEPPPEIPSPLTPVRRINCSLPCDRRRNGSPDPWTTGWVDHWSPITPESESEWLSDEDLRGYDEGDARYLLDFKGGLPTATDPHPAKTHELVSHSLSLWMF